MMAMVATAAIGVLYNKQLADACENNRNIFAMVVTPLAARR
jgi:hypothetical protein